MELLVTMFEPLVKEEDVQLEAWLMVFKENTTPELNQARCSAVLLAKV
jgi:hypothetical protein